MKILAIADIHGDFEAVDRTKEFARSRGIKDVLILGDFQRYGNLGNTDDAERILDSLEEFNLLAIPGNCDSRGLVDMLRERGINLHGVVRELPETGTRILGFGGSVPTEYDTPFEIGEDSIYESLSKISRRENLGEVRFILAVHCPPKDTECDLTRKRTHNGSVSIRRIVEEFRPELVLASHIHESAGKTDAIGKTRIINVGPLSEGNVAILEAYKKGIDVVATKLP